MAAPRAASYRVALLPIAIVGATLAGCSGAPPESVQPTGDAALLDAIEPTFAEDWERAAVAVIHGDEVNTAFVDAEESTAFEIGSITKVLTGELLAIAIERGEVALDDTLGEHLDLGDAPVASVTLEQLATHHSGLPYFPEDPAWVTENERAYAAHEDTADDDLAELLALARGADAAPGSEFEYSNFGAALLGHALASAAGIEYAKLLKQRVLDPLGMAHAVLVERLGSSARDPCRRIQHRGRPDRTVVARRILASRWRARNAQRSHHPRASRARRGVRAQPRARTRR